MMLEGYITVSIGSFWMASASLKRAKLGAEISPASISNFLSPCLIFLLKQTEVSNFLKLVSLRVQRVSHIVKAKKWYIMVNTENGKKVVHG